MNKVREKTIDLKKTKSKMPGQRMVNFQCMTLALPVLLKIFIFSYLPMIGIILAFKNLDYSMGIFGSQWVGLDNFKFFFQSNDAFRITYNTVVMNALFIVTANITAVVLALMLYQISSSRIALKGYQTIMFFPYFLSWVVVGIIFNNILGAGGLVESILKSLGLNVIDFYSQSKYWPAIFVLANIWKIGGYSCMIYFSVLVGTDISLYEAARIDGANTWQIMKRLQMPFLTPMIVLQVLMSIGNIFRADFGLFYFLPGAENTMILETTEVIDTYIYRAVKGRGELAVGAAVGLFQSFVGLILVTISNTVSKKIDPDYGIY